MARPKMSPAKLRSELCRFKTTKKEKRAIEVEASLRGIPVAVFLRQAALAQTAEVQKSRKG